MATATSGGPRQPIHVRAHAGESRPRQRQSRVIDPKQKGERVVSRAVASSNRPLYPLVMQGLMHFGWQTKLGTKVGTVIQPP